MTAPDARQQLERRAAELAQRPTQEKAVATVEVVTVLVGSRSYALEVRHVSRILRTRHLCRLPEEGGELMGLVMTGGSAVPVADLASLVLLGPPERTRSFVVLLGGAGLPLGLLVDEVESIGQVAEITPSGTDPDPDQTGSGTTGPVSLAAPIERGITTDGVVLLDAEALLAHPGAVAARTVRPAGRPRPPLAPTANRSQENA